MNPLKMKFLGASPQDIVLKTTTSRCTVCRNPVPAEVVKSARNGREQIFMRRECPSHGKQEFVIASDARFYWLAKGNPANSGCCCGTSCASAGAGKPGFLGSNALDAAKRGTIERLSTCVALIELVDSCNMACPTCYAGSPVGAAGPQLKYHSFDDVTSRIQGVLERKGHIDIIQFSGGEPTLHPEFFRLVEWVRSNPGIGYLVINTNGIRLAKDEAFMERLGEQFRRFEDIQIYLQFDGPQEAGQVKLRAADMRKTRERAIINCGSSGLPVTLAMTVNQENLGYVWDSVEYARRFEHVRGLSFQPEFLSGRSPSPRAGQGLPQPITPADIILGLNSQSEGLVALDDFTPLPCGDPNCATIGWLFRMGDKYYSPTTHGIDIPALQAKMPDRIHYRLEDLVKCGCDGTALGELMKRLELKESHAMRLFIKPFMDERTWDEDRIDRCCTHVIRPDGKLDSFCRYYSSLPV